MDRRVSHIPSRQVDRQRHVAPGAPDHLGLPVQHCRHRVVAAVVDLAVVHQEVIGDPFQLHHGLVVVDDQRVVADVGAGGDQDLQAVFEEQVVQRRIGQHHAQGADSRGDLRWQVILPFPVQDHDRVGRSLQEGGLFGREPAVLLDHAAGRGTSPQRA